MSNDIILESIVQEAIDANPHVVADYRKGKPNTIQALIGDVLKRTRGQAGADKVQQLLKKKLDQPSV